MKFYDLRNNMVILIIANFLTNFKLYIPKEIIATITFLNLNILSIAIKCNVNIFILLLFYLFICRCTLYPNLFNIQ